MEAYSGPDGHTGGAVGAVMVVEIVIGRSGIRSIGALPRAFGRPSGAGGSARGARGSIRGSLKELLGALGAPLAPLGADWDRKPVFPLI